MLKKTVIALLFIGWFFSGGFVAAQEENEPALSLRLNRDFGYGLGIQIQGRFSYRVEGPDDLVRVEFLLDDQVIGQDTEPPFRLNFTTDDYELGVHSLRAIGYTADGRQLDSNALSRQFVEPNLTRWLVIGLVVLVIGFRIVSYVVTRQRPASGNKAGGYGVLGGAVCPNCGRPYGMHLWGLNLMGKRLDRCPHCSKWRLVRRAAPEALAEAEAAFREPATDEPDQNDNEEDALRRQLDDSRFEDR